MVYCDILIDIYPDIALTTDIWTSIAVEAYMTVTVHYLDPNWVMQAFVLENNKFESFPVILLTHAIII